MKPDPKRIIDMASAFFDSCVLFTASDLGVFEKLAELGTADALTLAHSLKLDPRGTRLLMDACTALDLVVKENHLYRNSPESDTFLVPGRHGDLSKAIRYNRDVYSAWGHLEKMAQTGRSVEKPEIHLGEDRDRTRTFVISMHARALGIGPGLIPCINLTGRMRLLDVGGGPGTFSVLLAKAYPDLNCTVFDLPAVVEIAEELIEAQGMSARVKIQSGNYRHDDFPKGNDVVNIFGVLHQESPESIESILKKAYESLEPGGLIHVMDIMTDATHSSPKFSALFAVNMALTTDHGWVFSDEELVRWLEKAGFIEAEVQPLPPPMPHWLARARKP